MPFFIDVITTKRDDPNHIIDARKINYDKSKAREWLGKHSYWALRNGYAVHTAKAGELPKVKPVGEFAQLFNPDIVADIMNPKTIKAVERERERFHGPNDPVDDGADLPFYDPNARAICA